MKKYWNACVHPSIAYTAVDKLKFDWLRLCAIVLRVNVPLALSWYYLPVFLYNLCLQFVESSRAERGPKAWVSPSPWLYAYKHAQR